MPHFIVFQGRDDQRWRAQAGGYCVAWQPFVLSDTTRPTDPEQQTAVVAKVSALNNKFQSLVHNFHSAGHATAEEAKACYLRYLLDTQLRLTGEDASRETKCLRCDTWTTKFATVGGDNYPLCDTHRVRDEVEPLLTAEAGL